ncbi:MAG TPA: histidine kinase [Mucilaginibacter sp.]|jgi:sensor histidine kinase YesM|nr:histidine kinase [Mucilaginibacter sp.]
MRKFLLHLAFWVVFFLLWNRIMYFYVSDTLNRLYFSAWDVSVVILAFYLIYLYIMPDYFRRKSIARLVLLSCGVIAVLASFYAWVMGIALHHMLMPIHFDFLWTYADLQYNRLFVALLGVLGGCFVKLAIDRVAVRRKMEMMEKEKSLAELTYLKAQINPHFLFNALNSLYTQLEFNAEGAKGTLISLSELLRYQLYECNADCIPVAKELAYLENYFNLQRIRNDNCSTSFLVEGNHENLVIAPLLLIPFVENAFKYVSDFDGQENFIKIGIGFADGTMHFNCTNTFDDKSTAQPGEANNGIGLTNVRKRLELVYGDKFGLQNKMDKGIFEIQLTLSLK